MRPVVVFDTNILISGIGWQGNPHRCLELARTGVIEAVTCQELLDELIRKLRVKLSFSDMQVTDTVADLLTFLRLVPITNTLEVVTADPDDDKVLEGAVVGEATLLPVIVAISCLWAVIKASRLSAPPIFCRWCRRQPEAHNLSVGI